MKKILFITLLSVSELAFAFTPSQDQALVDERWVVLSINFDLGLLFGDRNTHSNSFTWFLVEQYKSVNGKVVRRNGKPVIEKSMLQAVTVNCQQQKMRINSVSIYQGSFRLGLERGGRNPKLISSTNNVGFEFLPTPNTFGESMYNYVCHGKTLSSQF